MVKPKHDKTIWVLTSEYNEYDQHGEYFVAVFDVKPNTLELADFFNQSAVDINLKDPMEAVSFLEHLRQGGGRRDTEDVWFNLKEVALR